MTDDQLSTKGKADSFTTLRIGRRALTTIVAALVGVIIIAGVAFGVGRLTSTHQLNPEVRPVITSVDHWGTLIESLNLGYEDFRPAAVDLPASVSQVATSNSTQICALDQWHRVGLGLRQLWSARQRHDGRRTHGPGGGHFPAGVKIASLPPTPCPSTRLWRSTQPDRRGAGGWTAMASYAKAIAVHI